MLFEDKSCFIKCSYCGTENNPLIIIEKNKMKKKHFIYCKECRNTILYKINIDYEQIEITSILKEVQM